MSYTSANCMGYALKRNAWACPVEWDEGYPQDMPEELETKFGWKPVKKQDMVLGREYVAFRWSRQDFHFMRRGPKGHWRHKPGGQPVEIISQKDVFSSKWTSPDSWTEYTSKIYLFDVS